MTRATKRAGFTLVELLVGLSIIIFLGGFVLMAYPGSRDQDRVRNTVAEVTGVLKQAQAMAARDQAPRGVRFLFDPTNKPGPNGGLLVTELQFIELPRQGIIFSPTPGSATALNPSADPAIDPRVRFVYTVAPATSTNPPAGTIIDRQCFIDNLTAEQADQIKPSMTITMPAFGAACQITSVGGRTPVVYTPPPNPPRFNQEVVLESYPDAAMGGAAVVTTQHFALYPNARGGAVAGAGLGAVSGASPLVGEPTILLPTNVCVDLTSYNPGAGRPVGSLLNAPDVLNSDFDVVFAPDGKLLNDSALFLLVRGYNKVPVLPAPGPTLADAFRRGGEMFYVTVRRSGAISRAEVAYPDAGGNYTGSATPFDLARQDGN